MSSPRRRWAICALLIGGAMGAARPAAAFCRTTTCPTCPPDDNECPTGTPIFWPQQCVSFSLQYRASEQVELGKATDVVQKAFSVWQNVDCTGTGGNPSLHLADAFGPVSCDMHEYNQSDANANIVVFRDGRWPYDDAAMVLALTTVTYSRRTGEIYDVDMEVNSTLRLSATETVPPGAYDLQSILTHEVGHFLGLAHSNDPTSTMWRVYKPGDDSFRALSDDDNAAICAVAPADQSRGACSFVPRQGFSPECGIYPSGDAGRCGVTTVGFGANGAKGWLALPLVAWAAQRVRARRRATRRAG